MKIRTTEKQHIFAQRLYETIPIHNLQGLTLDADYNFTAGIEAVEFEVNEMVDVTDIFTKDEWLAKFCLCSQLSVPLYVLTHRSESSHIRVYHVSSPKGNNVQVILHKTLETEDFGDWWRELKGTEQSKPLYNASSRVSYFDRLLEEQDLSWGGNIDGFILSSDVRTQAIIETRFTSKIPLEDYDPADFYLPHYSRAGDYKTWEPVVLLASKLGVPLLLFTFERESDEERIGFSVVDSMSKQELKYQGAPPNKNICAGIGNISRQIMKNLLRNPPRKL